jgi:hypothetical protein
MRARYWLDFRETTKVVAFAALTIAIVWFCAALPAEAWKTSRGIRGGGFPPLPLVMLISWIAGWFLVLFVKAEDTRVLAPFDFQTLTRLTGAGLIMVGFCIGVLFCLAFR